jgi:hypothetical protein
MRSPRLLCLAAPLRARPGAEAPLVLAGDRLSANLTPDTPFERRRGGFSFADGPAEPVAGRTCRIATTDGCAKNTARYFSVPAIVWTVRQPALRLKAAALAGPGGTNPPATGR